MKQSRLLKSFSLLFLCSAFSLLLKAQSPTLTCAPDVTVNSAAGQCGAVVNYTAPSFDPSTVAQHHADTFRFTGDVQTFVVPEGINTIKIQAWGAQGGSGAYCSGGGGLGGYAEGNLAVAANANLQVYVGGQPDQAVANLILQSGGYNGGGNHGQGGGGGGASDIRIGGSDLTNRIIVAGGGGGGGSKVKDVCLAGGAGGGLQGEKGQDYSASIVGGGGGTQTEGGASQYGQSGSLGEGGNVGSIAPQSYAGGGGGYYGGGSAPYAGAGGGSGYIDGVTNGSTQTGVNTGNGMVIISYDVPVTATLVQTAGKASGDFFPVGTTTNTFELQVDGTTVASCSFNVTVKDVTKPTISNVTQSKYTLTPPNHKMQTVTIGYSASDNCGDVTTSLSVKSNEPVSGTCNGDEAPDWVVIDNHTVQLRAEKGDKGQERIYTITITATDASGNQSTRSITVKVPHDNGSKNNVQFAASAAPDRYNNPEYKVMVSPDPATSLIDVHMNGFSGSIQLQLTDMQGRVLKTVSLHTANVKIAQQQLNVSDIASGTYFIVAVDEKGNKETKKVVVSH